MSHYQTGSMAILAVGLFLKLASVLLSSPTLRVAYRGYGAPSLLASEGRLVSGMLFILGLLISILGGVTYAQ